MLISKEDDTHLSLINLKTTYFGHGVADVFADVSENSSTCTAAIRVAVSVFRIAAVFKNS